MYKNEITQDDRQRIFVGCMRVLEAMKDRMSAEEYEGLLQKTAIEAFGSERGKSYADVIDRILLNRRLIIKPTFWYSEVRSKTVEKPISIAPEKSLVDEAIEKHVAAV